MSRLSFAFSLFFGALLFAAPGHAAGKPPHTATYKAHVEQGNVVVIVGSAKKDQVQRCATRVTFDYTDPKEPEKRAHGYQICTAKAVVTGTPTEMCRMDYPVTDIVLTGAVTVLEDCFPVDRAKP